MTYIQTRAEQIDTTTLSWLGLGGNSSHIWVHIGQKDALQLVYMQQQISQVCQSYSKALSCISHIVMVVSCFPLGLQLTDTAEPAGIERQSDAAPQK